MKTSLFDPSSWRRRKFPKPFAGDSQSKDPQVIERSETPISPLLGRFKTSREARRDTAASCFTQLEAPHRPPRPPSPKLYEPPAEQASNLPIVRTESHGKFNQNHRSNRTVELLKAKRSMPELDGVWKGFLEDVNEDHDSLYNDPLPDLPPLQVYSSPLRPPVRGPRSRTTSNPPRCGTLYPSKSTSNISRLEETPSSRRSSVSSNESRSCGTDLDSLALFPEPPPLKIGKKIPKPLVLLPTPRLTPLPPSPSTGSLNSTPIATPTSPTIPYSPRRMASPPSILKKSQSAAMLSNVPTTPTSPRSAVYDPYLPSSAAVTMSLPRPPRVTITQSMSNAYISRSMSPTSHKSSSSDTMALPNSGAPRSRASRNNTFVPEPRSDKPLPPLLLNRRQRNIKHPSPVEWGIAV
ncbi:hypothetical protein F5878DRAFT_661715 [Lentinula raphanica]|uniref:Uncharacterized protein n=1 Tax=Lentinula raphanica TaxID=153919 RepID=A0AA38P7R1_9AGAR|nr:hypothetical protein F5878DRAFT_661715 [Lentinula raphanica]